MQYLEEGVRRGSSDCMNLMASRAAQSDSWEEVARLYMMAARSGHDTSMHNLMVCYRGNLLSKDDLATTLRTHKAANDEGKSESREYAQRFMKKRQELLKPP